jgi:hypothetical protein
MKKAFFLFHFLFLMVALHFQSCQHDPAYFNDASVITSANCSPDSVYFVNEVLPVMQSNCGNAGCHNPSSAKHGVIMTDYVNIVTTGKVKAGEPNSSKLYRIITGHGEEDMPPSSENQLTSEQKGLIKNWIEQGAWNLACLNEVCDTNNYTFSGAVWPIMQNHCIGCHSGSNPGANVVLSNYQQIASIAKDPRFLGAITNTPPYKFMPWIGSPLSECKITQIRKWIEAGTPDN